MTLPPVHDHEIRKLLLKISEKDGIRLTTREIKWIVTVIYERDAAVPWTVEQRATACQIVSKYRGLL